jgi:hypothetical protein
VPFFMVNRCSAALVTSVHPSGCFIEKSSIHACEPVKATWIGGREEYDGYTRENQEAAGGVRLGGTILRSERGLTPSGENH